MITGEERGRRLRELMMRKGVGVRELGRRSGLSTTALEHNLKGKALSLDRLLFYAPYLGLEEVDMLRLVDITVPLPLDEGGFELAAKIARLSRAKRNALELFVVALLEAESLSSVP